MEQVVGAGDEEHYTVLGLPSGEEGFRLSETEIRRAYKRKAFELHPDKRPDDEEANRKFQKLQSSYEVLKDEASRKEYDDHLRVRIMISNQQRQERAEEDPEEDKGPDYDDYLYGRAEQAGKKEEEEDASSYFDELLLRSIYCGSFMSEAGDREYFYGRAEQAGKKGEEDASSYFDELLLRSSYCEQAWKEEEEDASSYFDELLLRSFMPEAGDREPTLTTEEEEAQNSRESYYF